MQGLIRCGVIAGLLFGCDTGGVGPTGDDVVPFSDAQGSGGPHGLVIEWSSAPALPSTGNPSVEQARFALNNLRVVGDTGDIRLAMTDEMRFNWSGSEATPMAMTFDNAPTGIYSQIALSFDGGSNDSYEIRGHVDVSGDNYEFRIEDGNPISFDVRIDVTVTPGRMSVVKLRINFTNALDNVDWANVNTSDGRKEIDENDPEMSGFRAKLISSFEVVSQ